MTLLNIIQNTIEQQEMLRQGDGVIVGVSGGPDSMCLLHLLLRLRESLKLTIRAVHLEHGFRGEASEADARYVEDFCRDHDVECLVYREDVRQQARDSGISEETAGREARYRLFFREKGRLEEELRSTEPSGTDDRPQVKIAVAHNKNDQAETILMRIMRGTGLEGLCGMEMAREDGIIRPLLNIDRSEIETYCEENGLEPRRDHTNEETDYTRNRIRLELIPYMKEHFNENVEEALIRLGSIASETQQVLRGEADRAEQELRRDPDGRIADRTALASLSDGLRHELIRRTLKDLGLTMNVSMVHLQQIDSLLESDLASGSVDLPQGYRVSVSYSDIVWETPDMRSSSEPGQPPDGGDAAQERRAAGRLRIIHQRERWAGDTIAVLRRLTENVKCFDCDKIRMALGRTEGMITEEDLTLRTRKPGDFIRPLGSPGRKKLQDWFVDQKIPRQMRDQIPLVCIGNEVLWIVGYRINENYKVGEQTKRLIFVEFHQ